MGSAKWTIRGIAVLRSAAALIGSMGPVAPVSLVMDLSWQ